jgi:tetratricopeptide (TPR) repeat protein
MRRFAVPFAVLYSSLYLTTASLWGQIPKLAPLAEVARAEDSPDTFANNEVFYNSPRAPEPQAFQAAGTVSVEQLQHPLSRKGEKMLHRAKNFSAMGDHGKAIAELRLALGERSAIPYAHSLLGSEYLKINQVPAAIEALEQAVKLLPRNAVNHSNLGFALFLMGYADRAEQEVRRALDLDRALGQNNEKTRHVLSLITHAREAGQ